MQQQHNTPGGGLLPVQIGNVPITMSSREIAELTGKRHDHVMRDIKVMLDDLEISVPKFGGSYIGENGQTLPCFYLPKRECLILVSGYSVELRAKIIDRWIALETGAARPLPTSSTVRELASVFGACKQIARLAGFKGNQQVLSAAKATRKLTGSNPLELLDATHLVAEVQEQYLGPRQIGEREVPPISAQRVNKALEAAGFQVEHRTKGRHAHWELTDAGKRSGGDYFDTGKKHSDGTPVKQIKWPASVINLIRRHLTAAA